MQKENEDLKAEKSSLESQLETLKTDYEKTLKEEKSKYDELNLKYIELLETNRKIVTNGAPLPDKDESEEQFLDLLKKL